MVLVHNYPDRNRLLIPKYITYKKFQIFYFNDINPQKGKG